MCVVESTPKNQMNAEFVRNQIRILQTLTRILTAKAKKTDDRRICQESEQILQGYETKILTAKSEKNR
jgi:hypothetical protein